MGQLRTGRVAGGGITDGPSRARRQAMLHAVGFDRDSLAKPIISVANTWTRSVPVTTTSRNRVSLKDIRAAGSTPMEFNTVSISDGIHGLARHARLPREPESSPIVELVARGNTLRRHRGLVGGKDHPRRGDGGGRLDIPSLISTADRSPRDVQGRNVTMGMCSRRLAPTRRAR